MIPLNMKPLTGFALLALALLFAAAGASVYTLRSVSADKLDSKPLFIVGKLNEGVTPHAKRPIRTERETSAPFATQTVTNGNDSGAGSLRDTIAAAASGDNIVFLGVTYVTLTSGELAINKNLTIDGGDNGVTIARSGTTQFRIFNISSGAVTFNKLTITNGNHPTQAGGIQNSGSLTMTDCMVSGNTSPQGGGIQNNGTLILTNSTLYNNSTSGNTGGALVVFGTSTTLTNCTISNNSAVGSGGGISISSGSLNMTNCTVANNQAYNGGGLSVESSKVSAVLQNTIVAANTATAGSGDIQGTLASASSYNLIGTGGAGGLTNGVNSNQVGVANPMLGVLTYNGGYTKTIVLLPGSPALDKGAAVSGITTDQRGKPRPFDIPSIPPAPGGNNSDIGAYEAQTDCSTVSLTPTALPNGTVGSKYSQAITANGGTPPYYQTLTQGSLPPGVKLLNGFDTRGLLGVPTLAGTYHFTVTATNITDCQGSQAYSLTVVPAPVTFTVTNGNDSGAGSLRDAIAAASAGDNIVFSGVTIVALTSGELAINKNLTIDGGNGVTITRSSTTQFRIFNITSGTVALSKLTITNGNHPTQAGGIQNLDTLSMTDCTVSGNTSLQAGGMQNNGVLTLTNCTLSNNSAVGNGGGLVSFGISTTLINCTISNNTAVGNGGGLSISSGSLNMTNCTVANNQGYIGGGLALANSSITASLQNTIVAANTATADSGDIYGILASASSYNLIGTGGTGGLTNGVNGNQVGVAKPLLGALTNNGGYTQTISLLTLSPALDKGAAVSGITTDQRGQPRPFDIPNIPPAPGGNNSDIGAYEVQAPCGTITWTPTSTFSPTELSNGVIGVSYSQTISASDGSFPYALTVTGGSLPPGLSLSPNGTISGEPTLPNLYNFTVTANDGFGCTGSHSYSITIACAKVTLAPTSLPNGTVGQNYLQTITASGGAPSYTFSVNNPFDLPPGLTFSPNGTLSGVPLAQGTFNFTVIASYVGLDCIGSQKYSMTVSR